MLIIVQDKTTLAGITFAGIAKKTYVGLSEYYITRIHMTNAYANSEQDRPHKQQKMHISRLYMCLFFWIVLAVDRWSTGKDRIYC